MNLSSYSPRGRKEETFRTEEQLAQGFEGSMPILCALLSSKSLSLSFSFLNLSPFALVILPVSLFTGKPPTPPDRDSSLPFPSRRDFLTYRFLEKVSFLETVFPNRGQPSSCKMTEVGGDTGTWEFVEEVELRSSCILYVRLRRSSIYYYYRSLAVLFTLREILIQTLERLRDNFFVEKILF